MNKRYELLKVFFSSKMPKEIYNRFAESLYLRHRGFIDEIIFWPPEDLSEENEYRIINSWLIDNGSLNDEKVLISYETSYFG